MTKWLRLLLSASCVCAWICFTISSASLAKKASSGEVTEDSRPVLPDDCQVHVIGIYSPKNSGQDDRVYVKVENTGKPMILVLCSYFGVQWNMDIDQSAQVKEIILSGWFDHSIVNISEDIPVKKIIGSPVDKSKPQDNYFWAYAWHTDQGRAMIEQVKALTGRSIDTFQGVYEGKRFSVDGNVGMNPEQTTEPDKPVTFTEANPLTTDQLSDPTVIERFVRKSFQLDMDAKQKRITEAEDELAKIKARYAKRLESAEQLIQERIAALVSNDTASGSKEATAHVAVKVEGEDVDDPTSKGWRLWQNQNWGEALRMFKIAVKRYPESGQAWNGLGWTHFHLGQPELAKTAFEKSLEIDPKNGGARNGLGRILMAMGKLDDAEKELLFATQESIDQYGEEQTITQGVTASWFGLIEVMLMKKDFAGAKEWAIRYLQHKPDEKQVMHWLNQAKAKMP